MATVLLIPGAGGSGWFWHLVARELQARGHRPVPVDLPAGDADAGLDRYVAAVVAALPEDAEDVALVAQSMGGLIAPLVCAQVPVRLLVMLNAMIPAPGETGEQWWAATGQHEAMIEHARGLGLSAADLEDPAVCFGNGVPPELFAEAGRRDAAQSGRPFGDPWPLPSWPTAPTRVIAAREDRLFPLEFQRRLARERLALAVDEVDGGHCAALSHPDQIADLFVRYAVEVGLNPP